MTEISMLLEMCWPQGLRWLPSESLSDLAGRKLVQARLDEQGTLTREGGNLLASAMGRMSMSHNDWEKGS